MTGRDRGAGSILTAALAVCIALGVVWGAWVIGWVTSVHRAGRIADLAAIAGAQAAMAHQTDHCETARAVATRNRGRVVECRLEGEIPSFVLRIEVETDLTPSITLPGTPRVALGRAVAGPGADG